MQKFSKLVKSTQKSRKHLKSLQSKQISIQSFATHNEQTKSASNYQLFIQKIVSQGVDQAIVEAPQLKNFLEYVNQKKMQQDLNLLNERQKNDLHERRTLTYQEFREYETWRDNLETATQEKFPPGMALTGGKGRSLSLMDGVVDVPPGFNVTTSAYFDMVKSNKKVYDSIINKLTTLDTMDDQKRDVVTREIREAIEEAIIPEKLREEVLAQYRNLNYVRALGGKQVPTPVAIRSSGTKEDIKVESWLPITTGSQAGQSDTYLNVKDDQAVIEKLSKCWASLFTDRATSYRDDAIFLIFSALIEYEGKHSKIVYMEIIDILEKYGKKLNSDTMLEVAEILASFKNPGSVNLLESLEQIMTHEKDNKQVQFCIDQLRVAQMEVVHPEQIGIDVVIMQMVQSYISGVLFSVNPPTGQAGVSIALYKSWFQNDHSLVHKNANGDITGTKPIIQSFEVAFGYGENVVGGKVDPDRFVTASYDGDHWFVLEKKKGTKLIQMIDVEDSLKILNNYLPRDEIVSFAEKVGKVIHYVEAGKQINGIFQTNLYGLKYFKSESNETDQMQKQRLQSISENISQNLIAKKFSKEDVQEIINQTFYLKGGDQARGVDPSKVTATVDQIFTLMDEAEQSAIQGGNQIANMLGSQKLKDDLILMLKEIWENNVFDIQGRNDIKSALNMDENNFHNLAYLTRSLIDKTFTCNILTYESHRKNFCINDKTAGEISKMAWRIGNYYEEAIDVEFGIEIDPTNPSNIRLNIIDKNGEFVQYDTKGERRIIHQNSNENQTNLKLYNLQARPYTASYSTVDYIKSRTELHEDFQKNLPSQPLARGTLGDNAIIAYTIIFDHNMTISDHANLIKRLKRGEFNDKEKQRLKKFGVDYELYEKDKSQKLPIALYLLEADPSHDPLMRLVDAVITIRGGETCHAAIFCREQGIPAVAGTGKFNCNDGDMLVVNALQGKIYQYKTSQVPSHLQIEQLLVKVSSKIKPYLIPYQENDTKVGYILASESVAQQLSPTMLSKDSAGIALSRAEFKGEELGINVIAGYAYDLHLKIKEKIIKEADLTDFQLHQFKVISTHPWMIDEIQKHLAVNGYKFFSDFIYNGFYYFYNNLGFNIGPDQIQKSRAYDFAQDKVQGLIGSELFTWRGQNPLVGLRGASLEIKDVHHTKDYKILNRGYQEILGFLLKANIRANRNTKNQAWFYVFIRTERELEVLAQMLKQTGQEIGHLPQQIGIMIEVPANAMIIERLGRILLDLKKDCKKYGVQKAFFSFGTNDYTNLAGKTDREDPRIQNLQIMDPAAKKYLEQLKDQGFYVDVQNGILPTALEGSDILVQLIEHVCAYGSEQDIDLSLCGQAIVKLVEMGLQDEAAKIMSLLNSFGVDPKNRLQASMLKFDAMRSQEFVKITEKSKHKILFKLGEKVKSTIKGTISGEIVYVAGVKDLIPNELADLPHSEREKKLQYLKLNNPKATSRVGDKIVILLTDKLPSIAEMEKNGVNWEDLQYARAILVDSGLKNTYSQMEIMDPKKGLTPTRVKCFVDDLKSLRDQVEYQEVTLDLNFMRAYKGQLEIVKDDIKMRKIQWTKHEYDVPKWRGRLESPNADYNKMVYHPNILLAYRDGNLFQKYEKEFDSHTRSILDDIMKLQDVEDEVKFSLFSRQMTKKIRFRIDQQGGIMKAFFYDLYNRVREGLQIKGDLDGELQGIKIKYFNRLQENIENLVTGNNVEDFIYNVFKRHMEKFIHISQGPVVHACSSLNSEQMYNLRGGFLAEQLNPNPDYGLLGASRALSDMWEINRLELKSFHDVRKQYKNLHLQITEIQGVQPVATWKMWNEVLKDMDLPLGKDGLEVGVNISTPATTLAVAELLKDGAGFVSYDKLSLGAAWAGVDIYWEEWELLARKWELMEYGNQAVRYIHKEIDQVNKSGQYGFKKVLTTE